MNPSTPPKAASVCIVDDEPSARKLLRELLEPHGYRLITASSGLEAMDLIKRELPDIILLDVMMPEMDGFEVCRRLRADEQLRQIPIILLTSLDDRRSRLQGFESGADDFISKPIDSVELRTRVGTITRLNRFRLLFEERERFRLAISHSPDAIVVASSEGRILFANEVADRFFTTAAGDDSSGRNLYAAFPPEKAALLKSQVAALETDASLRLEPFEVTLQHPHCDGAVVEITARQLPWQNGPAVQFIMRDVTEKKTLETQLLRSQRIDMLGQLASSMVHDLNNILTVIRASVGLIEGENPHRLQDHLHNIDTAAQRGAGLLRQLLTFARGSDGAMRSVHPGEIIGETASIVQETFGKLYSIKLSMGNDLPNIQADPTQVHQIIMNLCMNARDAMPAGGCLRLAAAHHVIKTESIANYGAEARPGEYVSLSIRDTGHGIAPEIRPRLFDPFFTTKPAGKGTGLGLATVLRIARRHRGFVTLESKPGEGACFACFFPIATQSLPVTVT